MALLLGSGRPWTREGQGRGPSLRGRWLQRLEPGRGSAEGGALRGAGGGGWGGKTLRGIFMEFCGMLANAILPTPTALPPA